ncbi:MAG: glutamate synthase subunit alpha, partial [Pseudomonadota bacterium]
MTKTHTLFNGLSASAATTAPKRSEKRGLYDPRNEHDACGLGFIASMKGEKSHKIVQDGVKILENLEHRGATGADPLMGDGAGMLVQIPHDFFAAETDFRLPDEGDYGLGFFFLPQDEDDRARARKVLEEAAAEEGIPVIGWRSVPVDNASLSQDPEIMAAEPSSWQIFFDRGDNEGGDAFERKLYVARRVISNALIDELGRRDDIYPVSMSARTVVYKGMFLADQLAKYYADLRDERFVSAVALVHQRFSTNTFPSWKLAHPYRMVAHNGEINTKRGNVNWMAAR